MEKTIFGVNGENTPEIHELVEDETLLWRRRRTVAFGELLLLLLLLRIDDFIFESVGLFGQTLEETVVKGVVVMRRRN